MFTAAVPQEAYPVRAGRVWSESGQRTKSLRDSRFAGGLGGDLIKLTHSAPRKGE